MDWIIGIVVIIGLVIALVAWLSFKLKNEPEEWIDEDTIRNEAIRVELIQRAKCILCIRKIKELKGNYNIDLDKFFCEKCGE